MNIILPLIFGVIISLFYIVAQKMEIVWKDLKQLCGKVSPYVLTADIIELSATDILDLRSYKDLADFQTEIKAVWGNHKMKVEGIEEEAERRICLRSMLLDFYATKNGKKLIIGNFKQRPQTKFE